MKLNEFEALWKAMEIMKKSRGYYDKEAVYGDEPLLEWGYEAENCLIYVDGCDEKVLRHSDLVDIFKRHEETVKEFKQSLKEHQKNKEE